MQYSELTKFLNIITQESSDTEIEMVVEDSKGNEVPLKVKYFSVDPENRCCIHLKEDK